MKEIAWGIIARLLNIVIPVRKKHWVFASRSGREFCDGPKNLMLYTLKHDKNIDCKFVSRDKKLYHQLIKQGVPCVYNFSFKGIIAICKADCIFSSHTPTDLLYGFVHKKKRHFFFMPHGQAYKVAYGAVSLNFWRNIKYKKTFIGELKSLIYTTLTKSGDYNYSEFTSSTSDNIAKYTKKYFPKFTEMKVLGSPRNDSLFSEREMQHPYFDRFKGKLVVTYMPTHRLYGRGEVSPNILSSNPEYEKWLKANNVVILIKQHPLMASSTHSNITSDTIIDITNENLDPFIVLYHTDVLISDYSSVWIDYLMLKRPIIHYFYDSFEDEDQGVLYSLTDVPSCHIAHTENEIYHYLQKIVSDYEKMCPQDEVIHFYHKYVDGNSSERHYIELLKLYEKN